VGISMARAVSTSTKRETGGQFVLGAQNIFKVYVFVTIAAADVFG
jgi:hypothetical protein